MIPGVTHKRLDTHSVDNFGYDADKYLIQPAESEFSGGNLGATKSKLR